MEKKNEKTKSTNMKRDLLIPILVIILIFTLLCCLSMTWTTFMVTTRSGYRELKTTIISTIFSGQQVRENINKELKFGSDHRILQLEKQFPKWKEVKKVSFSSIQLMNSAVDPEINMTSCQIVNRWGYKCERHSVTTEDGYILTIHRVPSTKKSNSTAKPYPVFLQHGLLSSSADWLDNLPNISLTYILADNGYDVWLGNFRGNFYSRNHVKLDPNQRPFWRFSWDEMASKDLPAMIHYVLNTTGSQDLFYAGHSQGTMTAFAQFSQNQELGHRVRMFFALAPVTTVGHMTDYGFNALSKFANEIRDLLYDLGSDGEFLPRGTSVITWMNEHVCVSPFLRYLCEDTLWAIAGVQSNELNRTRIPVFISQTPCGTSLENMIHFAQMVKSKAFQMYDFGNESDNLKHYNQTTPPLYDISTLKTPLAVYWGGKDWLADQQDVLAMIKKVRHIEHSKYIANYDHLDFLWAESVPEIIYSDMLKIMKEKLVDT